MRLTKKKEDGFYELKEGQEIYGEEKGIRLVQIVGQLEDIMEKYDINSPEELEHIILNDATGEDAFRNYVETNVMPYRNIEMKLGIKLEIYFTALFNGFYYKDVKGNICHFPALDFIQKDECDEKPCRLGKYYWNHTGKYIEDYGKTWALTKEELL